MSSFGVTDEGFVEKTLDDILTEVESDQKAAFGPAFDVSADGPAGQINGIYTDQLAQLWEVANAIYRSLYPDSSSGEALDNVGAITGALRAAATRTLVTLSLNMDTGTTVPLGSIVENSSTGDRFDTLAAVTNASGDPANVLVQAEAELTGPTDANSGSIDTIISPVTGWTAKAAINNTIDEPYALVDGQTLTIRVDGESPAQTAVFNTGPDFVDISIATAAEVAAVIDAAIIDLTSVGAGLRVRIESDLDGPGSSVEVTGGAANAVLGFSTALQAGINRTDEDALGADLEDDITYRIRRQSLLSLSGSATVDAIRSEVQNVLGVLEVFVFQNETNETNADGVPPKAVETVVDAPATSDEDLAAAIFDSVSAGIETFGTTTEIITDSQGFSQTIKFSRAVDVDIFADIEVVTNTDPNEGPLYPTDGDERVQKAIVDRGNATGIGDDVIFERIKCAAFEVPGVIDITSFFMDTTASPAGTSNIDITSREQAVFDSIRTGVVST